MATTGPSPTPQTTTQTTAPSTQNQASKSYTTTPTPYPAPIRTSSLKIRGLETTATHTSFSDKILVTVTQAGKLGHWIHVPLTQPPTHASLLPSSSTSSSSLNPSNSRDSPSTSLLPLPHLTATSILGGTHSELDTLGQTLATQVASAVLVQNAQESRMLVVGLGLDRSMRGRDEYAELVGLVLGVL